MHDNTRTLRSASLHQPTTRHGMHLLLSTMLRPCAAAPLVMSINIFYPHSTQQQLMHAAAAVK